MLACNISVGGSKFTLNYTEHLDGWKGKYTELLIKLKLKGEEKKRNESAVLTAHSQITHDEVQGLYVVV